MKLRKGLTDHTPDQYPAPRRQKPAAPHFADGLSFWGGLGLALDCILLSLAGLVFVGLLLLVVGAFFWAILAAIFTA